MEVTYVCMYVCVHVRTEYKSMIIKAAAIGTNFYSVGTQRTKTFISCFKTLVCWSACHLIPEGKSRRVLSTQSPGRLLQMYVHGARVIDYKPAATNLLYVLSYRSKWYVIRDPTMEKTMLSDIYCK